MISRTQFAAGAILFLQSIALGSNIVAAEIVDSRKLRGQQQQDDRDLAPFGFGQGYSYTTNSNRYSYSRTRDGTLGSQVLRPYAPDQAVAYQRPGRDARPPTGGPPTGGPPPGGPPPKGKAGKATKGFQPARPRPTNAGGIGGQNSFIGGGIGGAVSTPSSGGGGGGGSQQQKSFAGSMNWQRIPGQPLFVSRRDIPVIVLTEPYNTATDKDGNTVLVSPNGQVIVIKFDPTTGNWIVQSEDKENILQFDEDGEVLVDPVGNKAEPTVSPAPSDSPEPTIAPTDTPAPVVTPTDEPTRGPTMNPSKEPTKAPTMEPTKEPTKAPTKAPTKEPTKEPTKAPTKAPTKEPTKAPTKAPTKEPTPEPTASRRLNEEE